MGFKDRLYSALRMGDASTVERADPTLNTDTWLGMMQFGGLSYPFQMPSQTLLGDREQVMENFTGYIAGAYKANGVVFACELARIMVFSEARFQFRRFNKGKPGDFFSTPELQILEQPWAGATTGDLLSRALQDADMAGNAFFVRRGGEIRRLRPDWVTIVIGSKTGGDEDLVAGDLDTEIIGYAYQPGGPAGGQPHEVLGADEVAHFAPIPDPLASYRGMSWVTPVIREIMSDSAATSHKLKFFENGATVNMVVSLDANITKEQFDKWIESFSQQHEGTLNAYKTLYLAGGAKVDTVGSDMQQIDFKVVQGAGETRVAAAAGVPPIIVGLSEGLQAATYSNYGQARRRFADGTIRPLWRNLAGSLSNIINVPPGSQLWYDDRDIPFLQEDQTDHATIMQLHAQTMRTLIDGGFVPETVVGAVTSGDFTRLTHTGLFSVQLQPPGLPGESGASPSTNTNGSGNGAGNGTPSLPSGNGNKSPSSATPPKPSPPKPSPALPAKSAGLDYYINDNWGGEDS